MDFESSAASRVPDDTGFAAWGWADDWFAAAVSVPPSAIEMTEKTIRAATNEANFFMNTPVF
jgi:hypothetical protein